MNLLEKSVLTTIIYYDVLDHCLTGFEVFKCLINPLHIVAQSEGLELEPIKKISYLSILNTLNNLSKYIQEKNGFYFLEGKSRLYEKRIKRQKFSDEKLRKAKRIIKWFQMIPYIKMVTISGSVALDNAKKGSDIDLLIVVKHKRIWIARFLITLFVHVIGKRRYNDKINNRICLNHYITDKSLKIDFPSLYNAQAYVHLIPIMQNEKNIYQKFVKSNKWINDYLFNYSKEFINYNKLIKEKKILKFIAKIQELILNTFIGSFLEWILKITQGKIIKYHFEKNKKQGIIIADDFQLKFHPGSLESKFLEKYNKNILKFFKSKPEKDSALLTKIFK